MPEALADRIPVVGLPAGVVSVEFVSDLHLGPDMPRTCAAFLSWLRESPADALVILGDLFEAWVGDDALSQPFESACADALAQAAGRRPVAVMRGNRDFLLGDRFFQATGCIELPDPCVLHWDGRRVLLSHGDALCLADHAYQQFRAQVRQAAWQQAFLARPLAERQTVAAQMRAASQASQGSRPVETYADADAPLCLDWLAAALADTLVHGHTHRPATHAMGPQRWRWVLSDWDLDHEAVRRSEEHHV